MKISRIISIGLAIIFILAVARLDHLDKGGPPHVYVMLPGNEPATMYLPGPGDPFYTQFPKPAAERPPGVVLIHGFTGDRVLMSGLARRLADNGYGVLAIDVNGHGENRNPFNGSEPRQQQPARERESGGRLSAQQPAGRRIANRRDGAFDGRGRGARLRDQRSESQSRGDDFGRLDARSGAAEERAVHFCPARPGRSDPGSLDDAGGASGERAANPARQELRRFRAGQCGRSDPDAGSRSRDDREFAGGRRRDHKMAR